jgi:hypothetical protein
MDGWKNLRQQPRLSRMAGGSNPTWVFLKPGQRTRINIYADFFLDKSSLKERNNREDGKTTKQ